MRRAFTLIELLVIVAILAVMVGVGVGTIGAGKGAARVKGATRDIYAAIRHARSVALVTGQRVVLNYSNGKSEDDEPVAKIEVVSAKIMNVSANQADIQRYDVKDYSEMPAARRIDAKKHERRAVATTSDAEGVGETDGTGGETLEEVLFAPMNSSVVKGMRIKVVKGEEAATDETAAQKSHRISVSSNVDWLLGLYKSSKEKTADGGLTKSESTSATSAKTSGASSEDDMTEDVSVVWETNGAVEPHNVWVYAVGQKPEQGLMLKIDRFGAVKVLNGDGQGDERD